MENFPPEIAPVNSAGKGVHTAFSAGKKISGNFTPETETEFPVVALKTTFSKKQRNIYKNV